MAIFIFLAISSLLLLWKNIRFEYSHNNVLVAGRILKSSMSFPLTVWIKNAASTGVDTSLTNKVVKLVMFYYLVPLNYSEWFRTFVPNQINIGKY